MTRGMITVLSTVFLMGCAADGYDYTGSYSFTLYTDVSEDVFPCWDNDMEWPAEATITSASREGITSGGNVPEWATFSEIDYETDTGTFPYYMAEFGGRMDDADGNWSLKMLFDEEEGFLAPLAFGEISLDTGCVSRFSGFQPTPDPPVPG